MNSEMPLMLYSNISTVPMKLHQNYAYLVQTTCDHAITRALRNRV